MFIMLINHVNIMFNHFKGVGGWKIWKNQSRVLRTPPETISPANYLSSYIYISMNFEIKKKNEINLKD